MAHEYVESGVPFLRSQNIKRGRLDLSSVKYINKDFHHRLAKSQLQPGDLAIVRTGEPGATALIPDDLGPANCSDIVIARPGPDTAARYLCYAINATAQQFIDAHTVGAVQQHFNVASAKRLTVAVPPIAVQKAIASLLGALDDKIAVNDRIAETSYELAATEHARVAQLAGRACTLGDVIELAYGKALPAAQRRPGPVAVYGSGGVSGWHDEPLVRGPGIIVGRKGTVGSVYWSYRDFFPIDTTFYVRLIDDQLTTEYVYFLLTRLGLSEMNSDSAVPGLNRSRALSAPVQLPNQELIANFTERVRPLFAMREQTARQNQTLAKLRDTLLPELMSGRLRVRDAEKVVEESV
ncbi:restriction endonuclease subunit S [Micromonospora siamensis]